ncbi:uncharacterized protein LOC144341778, partial [Saccoglossus kowalevskii]
MEMDEYLDEAYQPLIVVLNNASKEAFNETNVNGYKYDIIGGQHSFTAITQLSEKYPYNNNLKSRYAVVYAGLTEEERKCLAHRHNHTCAFTYKMTFSDKVKMCKDRLQEMPESEETRSQWEKSCAMILKEKVDSVTMNVVFGIVQSANYNHYVRVFAMFGEGRVKAQKLKASEMLSTPQIPHTKFMDILLLSEDEQLTLLEQVLDGLSSITEMAKEEALLKKLKTV